MHHANAIMWYRLSTAGPWKKLRNEFNKVTLFRNAEAARQAGFKFKKRSKRPFYFRVEELR